MSGTKHNIETGDRRTVAISETNHVKRTNSWRGETYDLDDDSERKQFIERLSKHAIQDDKFGNAFVPAYMPGSERGGDHIEWLEGFVADVDNGMSADMVFDTCETAGKWFIGTTSHSHGKDVSEIPLDKLKQFNDKNRVSNDARKTEANIADFVKANDRYAGIDGFEFVSDQPRDGGKTYFLDIRHRPLEKTRAIFLFEAPFEFRLGAEDTLSYHYDLATDEFQWSKPDSRDEIRTVWSEGFYPAIAESIGLPIDPACKDPSRAYFLPACPAGRAHLKRSVTNTDRPCLDWRDYKDAAREKLIEYEKCKRRPRTNRRPQKTAAAKSSLGPSNGNVEQAHSRELIVWLAKYGKTHQFATMLKEEYPDLIKGERNQGGYFVDCANEMDHQEAHARTFVTDPDPESGFSEGFVFHCSGAQCDGVDRAERLQAWLDDGVISWSDLENEEYGGGMIESVKNAKAKAAIAKAVQKRAKKVVETAPQDVNDESTAVAAAEVEDERMAFISGELAPMDEAKLCAQMFLVDNAETPTVFRFLDAVVQVRIDPDTRMAKTRNISADDLQFLTDGTIATWHVILKKSSKAVAMPMQVAKYMMQLIYNDLPRLDGIADTPFFDADGQIVAEPGYHANSHTFYAPHIDLNVTLPPLDPTREQLEAARHEVCDPFCDMPYEDDAGLAHTISMMMHQLVRPMISGPFMAPLIHKPQPGEGSSLLIDVVSIIASGRALPTQTEKKDDEEWRKMLTGELLAGSSLIVIDNIHRPIEGSALAAFMTSRRWVDRLLGKNEKFDVENNCLLVFTGNNPTWHEEMERRLLSIRLNTGSADPKNGRTFKHRELREHVTERRNKIVSALLLQVQAWIAAGKPMHKTKVASFESYCKVIGGILDHAGIKGWLTNLEKAKENVSITNEQRLVEGLYDQFGAQPASVGKLEIDERTDDWQAKIPTTICQYVLKHADKFDWWWLKEIKTGWGGRIGTALTANRDRVYRMEDGSEVALRKISKGRHGVRYFIDLVREAPMEAPVRAFNVVNMSPRLAAKYPSKLVPMPKPPACLGSSLGDDGDGFQIVTEAA